MKYLGKKIATLIMTLFVVSAAAFIAFQIIPGDVVTSILGTEATPEREAQLREELGLNDPPVVRYFRWVSFLFSRCVLYSLDNSSFSKQTIVSLSSISL